jgi:PBP1b-binding outer membrane lipoprotein LpoB
MKKVKTILILSIAALILSSCVKNHAKITEEDYSIQVIDSCEYIVTDDVQGRSITHKGNCKFCRARKGCN